MVGEHGEMQPWSAMHVLIQEKHKARWCPGGTARFRVTRKGRLGTAQSVHARSRLPLGTPP
eukprot:scaffold1724_cov341-Pavlova_lutheri.AAC.31